MGKNMIPNPLFPAIILHYNQQEMLYTALDSVLTQNHSDIELVLADDCSQRFDEDKIREYIDNKKDNNIKNVIVLRNDQNVGRVRNVNAAIEACSGDDLLFFAADDSLYDETVVETFIDGIQEIPEDEYVLSAQCVMRDEKLEKTIGDFVNVPLALSFNQTSAAEQYKK